MLEFTRLKQNLKRSSEGFMPIRLGLLCDFSSQHLNLAIKGVGYDKKLRFEVYEADYDQIEQEVYNEQSGLYLHSPEVIVISKSSYKLQEEFYNTPLSDRNNFAVGKLQSLLALVSAIQQKTAATIILTNFQELDDNVYGNFANNLATSFLYQVRKLNLLLMEEAQQRAGIFICDVQSLSNREGLEHATDHKNLIKADMIWSLDFIPTVARNLVGIIEATKGNIKKCLVLDLDNTLWGGVVGDDGLEGIQLGDLGVGKAFSNLQKWVKELKKRGIIVCVCSKNNETIAREVFEKHPDMILKTEDIAVFAVNWNNKVDNIYFIKNTLNIGFDSMVFIDDNPFERAMVKEAIPELEVPEIPEDPVDYLPFLKACNLFETVSFTEEDEQRTALYRQEAERVAYQQVYTNEEEFLEQLQMQAEIHPLTSFTIPRAAQLSQRSNQFNLRTIRYTETELHMMAAAPEYFPFVVSLKDKFGDYGIICFIVLKKTENEQFFIENWMMSCRVLKRTVEQFVLNHIHSLAIAHHIDSIIGEYLPTAKNALVKNHYDNLGFLEKEGWWLLKVNAFEKKKTFIKESLPYLTQEVIVE